MTGFESWLADPASQRRARAGARQAVDDWHARADAQAVAEALDAALAADGADAARAALAPLFADMGWLRSWVEAFAAVMTAEPFADPPWPSYGQAGDQDRRTGITLVARDAPPRRATLRLHLHPCPQASFRFEPGFAMVAPAQGEAALLLMATSGRPQPVTLAAGAPLLLDRAREAISPAGTGPLLLVEAAVSAPGLVRTVAAGQEIRHMQGQRRARLAASLPLLRTLDPAALAAPVHEAVASGEPGYRWMAVREWLAADPAAALPLLQRLAAEDADPGLRALAAATVARLRPAAAA